MICQIPDDETRRPFWRRHALWPGLVFAALFAIMALSELDLRIADEFFFNRPAGTWIGAHSWWANVLIHTGGSRFVRLIGLVALLTLASGFWLPRVRRWRRDAAYVALALVLVPSVVGAHFLSHDLASAAIAWFVSLALWRLLLASGSGQEPGRQPSVASSSANPTT
jgi:membrane-associated PAP2 superfamily phosphatase